MDNPKAKKRREKGNDWNQHFDSVYYSGLFGHVCWDLFLF